MKIVIHDVVEVIKRLWFIYVFFHVHNTDGSWLKREYRKINTRYWGNLNTDYDSISCARDNFVKILELLSTCIMKALFISSLYSEGQKWNKTVFREQVNLETIPETCRCLFLNRTIVAYISY